MSDDPGQSLETATPQEIAERRVKTCPLTPLGYSGLSYIYQTRQGDVIALAAKEHSHMNLLALFGGDDQWLWDEFPQKKTTRGAEGETIEEVIGWSLKPTAKWLLRRCHAQGRFDVERDLRGPGVWRAEYPPDHQRAPDDPALIVHVGDALWLGEVDGRGKPKYQPLRRIGRYVYAAARPLMRPADKASTLAEVSELHALIKTWSWSRRDIDPVLLLGWVAVALIVGAIDWRPSLWLVGDRETGKTTLQTLIEKLLGANLLRLSETTAPALRQLLRGAALPTGLDELEAEEINTRSLEVVKLARLASTRGAGRVARGGADGTATLYNIETTILYSSILVPPLPSADLRRIAMLLLGKLPPANAEAASEIHRKVDSSVVLGPKLFRRMLDGWGRFEIMLGQFQRRLAEGGHSGGACDQFGTLLAAAWVLLRDDLPEIEDELAEWTDALHPSELAARSDDRSDHDRLWTSLISSRDMAWRDGHQRTIAEMMRIAAGISAPDESSIVGTHTMRDAQRDLGRMGIRVYPRTPETPGEIAIANSHAGLARLFEGTHWATRSGATGGWVVPLGRLPGAVLSSVRAQEEAREKGDPDWQKKRGNIRFGDVSAGAMLLPLELLELGDETS